MKNAFLFFLLLISLMGNKEVAAQYNYVPNPSFEEYDSIPIYIADSVIYNYYYFPKDWFIPVSCWYGNYFSSKLNYVDTTATGDTLISGYGAPENPWSYTMPYDGIAQSAFCPFEVAPFEGLRDYLEVRLKNPLTSGTQYCVSFYISLSDSNYIAIDQVGACFTLDSLIHFSLSGPPCYLLLTPQIEGLPGYFYNKRNQWQCVSGKFIAQGGEQFLTIGNFKNDASTDYLWVPETSSYEPSSIYFIDMVSVIVCDSNIIQAQAGKDTTICKGDSIMLGPVDTLQGYEFFWLPGTGLSDSCIKNPMASPLQTTTYLMCQTYFSSDTTTDTVTVTVKICDESVDEKNYEKNIIVYPNPFTDITTLSFSEPLLKASLIIYDIFGKEVKRLENLNGNEIRLSRNGMSKGMYFFRAIEGNIDVGKGKMVVD